MWESHEVGRMFLTSDPDFLIRGLLTLGLPPFALTPP